MIEKLINNLVLVCVIVNFGQARKILKHAKLHGIKGGTVFLGKGTIAQHKWLDFLDIAEVRKEIVFMFADKKTIDEALEKLDEKFKFSKPHHGIVFTTSVRQILGSSIYKDTVSNEEAVACMHHAIFTIIDRGKAEEVVNAAKEAGSRGGTIINARGSGIHETAKLFNMEISPEKEIVLILSEAKQTDEITALIRERLQIDEPGNGVIFVQDVAKTYGLY